MLQNLQNIQNIAKFQKFQLENLVDFEKRCKTHILLQKSEPIQPKTSNILPKFCQPTLSDVGALDALGRTRPRHRRARGRGRVLSEAGGPRTGLRPFTKRLKMFDDIWRDVVSSVQQFASFRLY